MSGIPPLEYNGFYIQIKQNPVEIMTGDAFWKFNVWQIGEQARNLISNGKQYGGYEVALYEAKKFIDETNKNTSRSL